MATFVPLRVSISDTHSPNANSKHLIINHEEPINDHLGLTALLDACRRVQGQGMFTSHLKRTRRMEVFTTRTIAVQSC
ncbi:hypothetical protein K443DRAFT_681627 [Laccaria amethystina LaAM-08-1]|uniref:Uncharacterized protein n=1 Tax=Laccaria amethystina LaAM-08-1 TaxID=1095629 RepID=A0A0C9XI34_9AGAR|nr:hypothetical protein K443DRAFT_681627 [Laccaria amethystina LaAM-08-1]